MTIHPPVYADNEAQRRSLASSYGAFNDNSLNSSAKSSKNEVLHDRMLVSRLTLFAESLMGEKMSEISKEVLNAKLAQNKAEVSSVASDMKTEMANFRTAYVESFAELSKTLSRIESKADSTEKRLTQAQWIVSLVISICAVTLSAVIFFSNKNTNKSAQQQQATPQMATQVPQQAPTQQIQQQQKK